MAQSLNDEGSKPSGSELAQLPFLVPFLPPCDLYNERREVTPTDSASNASDDLVDIPRLLSWPSYEVFPHASHDQVHTINSGPIIEVTWKTEESGASYALRVNYNLLKLACNCRMLKKYDPHYGIALSERPDRNRINIDLGTVNMHHMAVNLVFRSLENAALGTWPTQGIFPQFKPTNDLYENMCILKVLETFHIHPLYRIWEARIALWLFYGDIRRAKEVKLITEMFGWGEDQFYSLVHTIAYRKAKGHFLENDYEVEEFTKFAERDEVFAPLWKISQDDAESVLKGEKDSDECSRRCMENFAEIFEEFFQSDTQDCKEAYQAASADGHLMVRLL